MTQETIEKLCCPFDKSDLILKIIALDEYKSVHEGILICVKCNRIYPIISGIPVMNPDEFRDFNLEQPLLEKWEKALGIRTGSDFKLVSEQIRQIR